MNEKAISKTIEEKKIENWTVRICQDISGTYALAIADGYHAEHIEKKNGILYYEKTTHIPEHIQFQIAKMFTNNNL